MIDLLELLAWFVTGGGSGVLAYLIIDKVPRLAALSSVPKRALAYVLTCGIALAAWAVMLVFGYVESPGAWPAQWHLWVEGAVSIAMVAFGAATALHTKNDLGK